MRLVSVGACVVNQWAMDVDGNVRRVIRSIQLCKEKGCKLRIGPELELSGYGCEDHFLEPDTVEHCWEALRTVMESGCTENMACDIGMPVAHNGVVYNCRVHVQGRRILLIRPKLFLCDDGNYRESRHFTRWSKQGETEDFLLPARVREATSPRQERCPFGDAMLEFACGTKVATETCEELWAPNPPHIRYALAGAHIIANGSGSHWKLKKLRRRKELVCSSVARCGGVYVYSNLKGCDGSRVVYDGASMIAMNDKGILAKGSQFEDLGEVEVVTATVDIDEVMTYRQCVQSRNTQADEACCGKTILSDFALADRDDSGLVQPTPPLGGRELGPMEEIARGPALWLWDYLRRSSGNGFLIPLSGGADSAAVLAICGSMCQMVVDNINRGQEEVLLDARRIARKAGDWTPKTPRELASCLLHTCYMSTESNSDVTKDLAQSLAQDVGSFHYSFPITTVTSALVSLFGMVTGSVPRFVARGGTMAEDLALQNIQARVRMVIAYMMAQLLPWTRSGGTKPGWLLVLSTGNVDEALRGYMTKYDCSSGDLNPIGAVSKTDLKKFLEWGSAALGYPNLKRIAEAKPSAELRPTEVGGEQLDEAEMGMTYEELGIFGRLRKLSKCGPVSMFEALLRRWPESSPSQVAEKVKRFFRFYAINRHKMTTITPSCHAEDYSPDDNRYDLRQILYRVSWDWQFTKIDQRADQASRARQQQTWDPHQQQTS
ncbi:glutamine-dependent NAD(+) synthetase [Chloropicon primus]|uniref:Glutamine-dependent NAD(+) synthetase n=1 Tax=Chloropicon primus TaxID=1764295 RepID=A0A5B8MD17_9CHLO|nr:glutamine-dependent NAD(+) synthetase [Chloropicon primus]UPQ96715.1 glutamine-dependent NAD(+) synthetase [Chloropicon primus]|eukprot:QDZ17495.1 glutamine-dependent NAD(+) synthetase [Chloropicon primus]